MSYIRSRGVINDSEIGSLDSATQDSARHMEFQW